jgi:transglutaminase-like putative cysteine protease
MYRIRIGGQLDYFCTGTTPAVFLVHPRLSGSQKLLSENFQIGRATAIDDYHDTFGNHCRRVLLADGANSIRYDATVETSSDADIINFQAMPTPAQSLPPELLRFTLPSRYVETDKLLNFAWQNFNQMTPGWARAQAICNWVERNIEYKLGTSLSDVSANEILARGQGVCRDLAHLVIALCRAFNMPARYTVSYLPDIDVPPDLNPMDFHAVAEVWFEGDWYVFDPHFNTPRKGRIRLAHGLDAVDTAFATLYGAARMTRFEIWTHPVNEHGEKINLTLSPLNTTATFTN